MIGANGDIPGYNMFAYCSNNPVIRVDPYGLASYYDFDNDLDHDSPWSEPGGGGGGSYWSGDVHILSDIFPTGMNGAYNPEFSSYGWSSTEQVIDYCEYYKTHNCSEFDYYSASRSTHVFEIDTYRNLRKKYKGTDKEVHHIIEKRFNKTSTFGKSSEMGSIALSRSEHRVFTNDWRKELPYGSSYSISEIYAAAKVVYANYPQLVNYVYEVLFGWI